MELLHTVALIKVEARITEPCLQQVNLYRHLLSGKDI